MIVTNYTEARAGLKKLMDQVVNDHDHAIITRQGGEPVVMVSLSNWKSMDETNYLMSTPENAARMRQGLAEFQASEWSEYEPVEP